MAIFYNLVVLLVGVLIKKEACPESCNWGFFAGLLNMLQGLTPMSSGSDGVEVPLTTKTMIFAGS